MRKTQLLIFLSLFLSIVILIELILYVRLKRGINSPILSGKQTSSSEKYLKITHDSDYTYFNFTMFYNGVSRKVDKVINNVPVTFTIIEAEYLDNYGTQHTAQIVIGLKGPDGKERVATAFRKIDASGNKTIGVDFTADKIISLVARGDKINISPNNVQIPNDPTSRGYNDVADSDLMWQFLNTWHNSFFEEAKPFVEKDGFAPEELIMPTGGTLDVINVN